ncbi:hypothetical protein D3C81_2305090 [compost metagenome]
MFNDHDVRKVREPHVTKYDLLFQLRRPLALRVPQPFGFGFGQLRIIGLQRMDLVRRQPRAR